MDRRLWFDRAFDLGLPLESYPETLERIRGTALRLRERVSHASGDILPQRLEGKWSIQEHVGHLVDLEALWAGRLDDFDRGAEILRPADVENRATWEANHNDRNLPDLLGEFETSRADFVQRCEAMGATGLSRRALHPRLAKPMSVVDLMFFIAEHDDHHLASISELLGRLG